MTLHRTLPPAPPALPTTRHVFRVLVPIARTNEILNPSFERDTSGWSAVGGSILRLTFGAWVGNACLLVTMSGANDGVRYTSLAMTAGELRAISLHFKGTAGRRYRFKIENGLGGSTSLTTITASGRWQEVVWYCTTETTGTYYLFVGAQAVGSDAVLLDGVQSEVIQAGETYSTYIDGDQRGLTANESPPAYTWNGVPHASTSTRTGRTRAGGMVMSLKLYNLLLTSIIGLGLAMPQNSGVSYAQLDGGYDDFTRKPERQFTLVGRIDAASAEELHQQRGALARLFDRDASPLQQQLRMLYHREDGCGTIMSDTARIDCKYVSGLGGNHTNSFLEDVALTFQQYVPYVTKDNEESSALTVQQTVTGVSEIVERTPDGSYRTLGSGITSYYAGAKVYRGVIANNLLYIVGTFDAVGGVANTKSIAVWDRVARTWASVGGGSNLAGHDEIRDVARGPDGRIWVVGHTGLMGGVANTARVAWWNGSVWAGSASTPSGSQFYAVATNLDGTLIYAGRLDGNIYSFDGTTWTLLGNIGGGGVFRLIVRGDGTLFAARAGTTTGVYQYTGSSFVQLGAFGSSVFDLTIAPTGQLYAAGSTRIAKYVGTAWRTVVTTSGPTQGITVMPTGELYVASASITIGALSTPDGLAVVSGNVALPIDIDLPGPGVWYQVLRAQNDGTLYIMGDAASGSAIAAASTTINNSGTARAYPTLVLSGLTSGTARVYSIQNTTTGRIVAFGSLALVANETLTIDFDPTRLSVTSDIRGPLASPFITGSQESDFFLAPGRNTMSLLVGSSSAQASLRWRPTVASLDDL